MAQGSDNTAALQQSHDVVSKVQGLGGLELAMLLSMMAGEHCLVQTESEALDATADTIELIADRAFGIQATCIECTEFMTIEDFRHDLLGSGQSADHFTNVSVVVRGFSVPCGLYSFAIALLSLNYLFCAYKPGRESIPQVLGQALYIDKLAEASAIANVVVAKNLSHAPQVVQMQALELVRTRRIFTQSAIYTAPSPFLLLPLTTASSRPLTKHLNDFMFISHYHNLEPAEDDVSIEQSDGSRDANIRPSMSRQSTWSGPAMTKQDMQHLILQRDGTVLTVEMKRYLHNVLVFLRMHRAVAGGVTAKASRDFEFLTKCLAPLNGLAFVTPSIVALAARKVYRHRLQLATVEEERSMQYGSDAVAVAKLLQGLTPDIVIEQVLQEVEVPL